MAILSVLLILITTQNLTWGFFDCSFFFQYVKNGNEAFGLIEVPPIQFGQELTLNVQLSLRAPIQNCFGSLELVGTEEAALKKVQRGQDLQYRVIFPTQNPLPKLIKIVYNGQEICSTTVYSPSVTTFINLEHTLSPYNQTSPVPITTQTATMLTRAPNQRPIITNDNNNECGITTLVGNPLVYNGSPSAKGEFPWLAVIYVKKTRNLEFRCSGTLISDKIVVTAGHCIHLPHGNNLTKNDILLSVGQFDLDEWGNSVTPEIENIFVHPDYNSDGPSFDADIAVITLRQEILFTQFIRPICLGLGESPSVSQSGTVVGWGRDETGVTTSKPNKIKMPVVSNQTCLDSEPTYQYIISHRTFCAGYRNGSAPCNGDSGGGFIMKIYGKWFLRGIVSVGLYDEDTKTCAVRNYSVFTDVAKFLSWINMYL